MTKTVRVVCAAVVLSALSFAAGIAGDLSEARPASGVRVVVRIPPAAEAAPAETEDRSSEAA